jgi:hypothetical protein
LQGLAGGVGGKIAGLVVGKLGGLAGTVAGRVLGGAITGGVGDAARAVRHDRPHHLGAPVAPVATVNRASLKNYFVAALEHQRTDQGAGDLKVPDDVVGLANPTTRLTCGAALCKLNGPAAAMLRS